MVKFSLLCFAQMLPDSPFVLSRYYMMSELVKKYSAEFEVAPLALAL